MKRENQPQDEAQEPRQRVENPEPHPDHRRPRNNAPAGVLDKIETAIVGVLDRWNRRMSEAVARRLAELQTDVFGQDWRARHLAPLRAAAELGVELDLLGQYVRLSLETEWQSFIGAIPNPSDEERLDQVRAEIAREIERIEGRREWERQIREGGAR